MTTEFFHRLAAMLALLIGLGLAPLAAQQPAETETETAAEPDATPDEMTDEEKARLEEARAARRARRLAKLQTTRRGIDWDAVARFSLRRSIRRSADGGPPQVAAMRGVPIDECHVPVMIPTMDGLAARAMVVLKADFYTAFMQGDGFTVEITGTRLARAEQDTAEMVPAMQDRLAADQDRVILTRSDYGVDLSVSLFGVAYNITVLCEQESQAPICREDRYVRRLARSMTYIGGQPYESEGRSVTERQNTLRSEGFAERVRARAQEERENEDDTQEEDDPQ